MSVGMGVGVGMQATAAPMFDPGGIRATKTTTFVKVIQGEFLHDMAVITLRDTNMSVPELQPGTPVRLDYGWSGAQMEQFYGYIDHIESSYQRMVDPAGQYHDVVCLGASYLLKDALTGSWTSAKASDVISGLATMYYLSSLTEVDDPVWPSLSCPGQSAWSYAVSLAQKLGYTLACNQTLLRFMSVDQALNQSWSTMSVFRAAPAALNTNWETVVSFEAFQGEATGLNGQRAIRSAGGIDLRTGQIINVADDASSVSTIAATVPYPFFTQTVNQLVVNDQTQGQASLTGLSQRNRFHYSAKAIVSGDTSVKQGMPVVLLGLEGKDNGAWWVQEVCHKFQQGSYILELSLGRDSSGYKGPPPVSSSVVTFDPSNPYSFAMANVAPTILVNNKWRSSFQTNTQMGGS